MFSGEGEGARLLTGGTHHKSYGGEDYVSEKEDEKTTWELEQHDEDYSRNPHIEEAARTIASAANLRSDVPDSANLSPVEKFFYVNIKYFRWVALTLMLVFTFFEKPWWCYQYPANCAQTDVYLNSGFEQLPQFVTDMIQFVCLLVLSFDLIIHYRVFGQHILKDITVFLRTGIIVVSVIDTFVALVWVSYHDTIFISPFLRPCLFAIVSPQVRTKIIQIVRIVPIIAELLALLGLLLFSFSWFGVLLFFDDEQLLPNTEQDTAYFSSFWDALLSLFVLLTTANNPDVRMPVFWSARPSFLFFAIFLIIGMSKIIIITHTTLTLTTSIKKKQGSIFCYHLSSRRCTTTTKMWRETWREQTTTLSQRPLLLGSRFSTEERLAPSISRSTSSSSKNYLTTADSSRWWSMITVNRFSSW